MKEGKSGKYRRPVERPNDAERDGRVEQWKATVREKVRVAAQQAADEVFGPTSTGLSGRTVFHASTVRGGTDYATYPSEASVGIEIGTQPGEHIADRLAEIDEILDIGRKRFPDLDASVTVRVERDPFFAEGHTPILDALRASALMQLGRTVEPSGVNAWTDAALMQNAGVPTVLLGPTGGNLHAPDEWVSIPDTLLLYNLLLGAIHIILA